MTIVEAMHKEIDLHLVQPRSSEWAERVRGKGWLPDDPHESYEPLKKCLLAIGGHAVVLHSEPDYEIILRRGRLWSGKDAVLKKMRPISCHENSAELYAENMDKGSPLDIKIATGYALSSDGLWRSHSWAVLDIETVIETTVPRLAYYGCVLDTQESKSFVEHN